MSKNKLQRFQELHTFPNVIEAGFEEVYQKDHFIKGNWHSKYFINNNPIVLELGCGKGEYTINLAALNKNTNYIGIDIKGNRLWVGANKALLHNLSNVAFIRTRIEFITSFFDASEIDEIWITFPDPQVQHNRRRKRLTSPSFLNRYKTFLKPNGYINLKTDSRFLYDYTLSIIKHNKLPLLVATENLYHSPYQNEIVGQIKTYYEEMYLAHNKPIHYLKFSLNGIFYINDIENDR